LPMSVPDVVVLGVCDRAIFVAKPGQVPHWNFLGVREAIATPLLPFSLSPLRILFAIRNWGAEHGAIRISITDDSGEEVGSLEIGPGPQDKAQQVESGALTEEEFTNSEPGWFPIPVIDETWTTVAPKLPNAFLVQRAGKLHFSLEDPSEGTSTPAGTIHVIQSQPLPLTAERVAAIRSDPAAARTVRAHLACNKCGDEIQVVASIEKREEDLTGGAVWYEDLPDKFECSCGSAVFPLHSYRTNLHTLLGSALGSKGDPVDFVPLYEQEALQKIRAGFLALLDTDPGEEPVQKYLENNSVLLAHFSPQKLLFKKPILSFFVTDFVILTPHNELLLIEIEKPGTRLLKSDGGIAAKLQHAFDQVRSWRKYVRVHFQASLESIGVKSDEVSSVKYVVIAGRDQGYDESELRELKSAYRGEIQFFTYDDIVRGFSTFCNELGKL
jgi:hypothetical protein